ncbi:MAG: glycosyltransferase family 1 protein [Candidatus Saccharimonas sp.]|nr:MAG: glycosyltransferase family 1 protein [Candidatus Saccharimonas sp.]
MRITFLGNFISEFSSETHHSKTLKHMGHEVIDLQEGQTTKEKFLEESLNSDLAVVVHTHSMTTPGNLSWKKISKKLRKKGIPLITYHLDLWFGLERQKDLENDEYYKNLHYFFTVDKLMADWFNKNTKVRGVYLPAAVYKGEVIMMKPQPVSFDIIFTGSVHYHPEYPYRQHLINFLKLKYGDKFLHIGSGGEIGQLRGLELNQAYRNAKIAVGDTLCLGFTYPYYFSDRLFEQPGRGAFQIFPDIKGVEDMYEDGKEIVLYRHGDLDDLGEKIDYYLEHEQEREEIRQNGFNRTKKEHTYTNRWEVILNELFS